MDRDDLRDEIERWKKGVFRFEHTRDNLCIMCGLDKDFTDIRFLKGVHGMICEECVELCRHLLDAPKED